MSFRPIHPPLRPGQRVVCIDCGIMTAQAVSVTVGNHGSFVCGVCLDVRLSGSHAGDEARDMRATGADREQADRGRDLDPDSGLRGF